MFAWTAFANISGARLSRSQTKINALNTGIIVKKPLYFLFLFLASLVVVSSSCDKLKPRHEEAERGEQKKEEAIPAHVMAATSRQIVDCDELTGRTAAVESVDVLAQVSGYLESINFTPGSFVHKGDVLFTLDSRVYKATLDEERADVAAKRADLDRLEAALKRQQGLFEKNATSQQQLELAIAERDSRQAELNAALASAELAKIDLDYATIRSPIDGVVSREQITVGNLVSKGSTLLTKVVAVDPIHVYFDVDERTLLIFRQRLAGAEHGEKGLVVKFAVGDGGFDYEASVDFSEPSLNDTTGTLEFRSVAKNPVGDDGLRPLVPGLRVRVLFPTSPEYEAVLIPEEAIVADQNVKRVYVVTEANEIESRQVVIGPLQDDNMRVVKEGLEPGERVVVDNLLRIRPGVKIDPLELETKSTTQILREDGTYVFEDGSTTNDDVYQWSLER